MDGNSNSNSTGFGMSYSYAMPSAAPTVVTTMPGRVAVYPLRTAATCAPRARIEARAPGPVSVNEVGDSLWWW